MFKLSTCKDNIISFIRKFGLKMITMEPFLFMSQHKGGPDIVTALVPFEFTLH